MHQGNHAVVFIARAVVFCAFFSIVTATAAQVSTTSKKLEAPALYERVLPSVVVIASVDSAGEAWQGSGVILRHDGVIATNFHVAGRAVSARVTLSNGDVYDDVTLVDADERRDIAIMKIKAVNLPFLPVANSDTLKIGTTVYAIGAPVGLSGSLSSGIVSGIRPASDFDHDLSGFRVVQFTAPISGGNSGGPLVDEFGSLVGLVFASRRGGQNINVAIPSNYVAPLVANARNEGRPLQRMTDVAAATPRSISTDDVSGTYTGIWWSDKYSDAYGNAVLTISIVKGQPQAHVSLTGSEMFKQDTLIVLLTRMGSGIWKMDFKSKNGKINGSGFFRGNTFVGDYKFRRLLWTDNGKWKLEK